MCDKNVVSAALSPGCAVPNRDSTSLALHTTAQLARAADQVPLRLALVSNSNSMCCCSPHSSLSPELFEGLVEVQFIGRMVKIEYFFTFILNIVLRAAACRTGGRDSLTVCLGLVFPDLTLFLSARLFS